MEKHEFLRSCLKLLDTQGLNENMLAARAVKLIQDERLVSYDDSVFRSRTARVESNLAYEIVKKLDGSVPPYEDLDKAIAAEERKLRFRLAPEQKEAIKMALTSKFCVITGGPGTGKTSVQRALLDLYRERFPSGKSRAAHLPERLLDGWNIPRVFLLLLCIMHWTCLPMKTVSMVIPRCWMPI